MNVFRVQCMGEEHRVALVGKRLAFLDHPRDEMALMRAIGEKSGCLRFKEEFGTFGHLHGDSYVHPDDLPALLRVEREMCDIHDRRALARAEWATADPLLQTDVMMRLADLRANMAWDLAWRFGEGLRLGAPVRELLIGTRGRLGFIHVKGAEAGTELTLVLSVRWFRTVFRRGAVRSGFLVLGSDGDFLRVLWLRARGFRAKAVEESGRIALLPFEEREPPEMAIVRV